MEEDFGEKIANISLDNVLPVDIIRDACFLCASSVPLPLGPAKRPTSS
jgi:hypothetical protein